MLNNIESTAFFGLFAMQFAMGAHMVAVGTTNLNANQNNGALAARAIVHSVVGVVNMAFGYMGMYVCSEPEILLSHRSIQ